MQYGMYERVIDRWLNELLMGLEEGQDQIFAGNIDEEESPTLLARHMDHVLEMAFKRISGIDALDKRIQVVNSLIQHLASDVRDPEITDYRVHEDAQILLAVLDARHRMRPFTREDVAEIRPVTSLAQSSLLTGSPHEPSMIAELKREIRTADSVDMLVAFVKWSGLRLMMDELRDFTEAGRRLRLITTSYMGATDVKAVDELVKLPNTEIRVSYDAKRTRLHAKAYMFHRKTGYSTAYVGSSNVSESALTAGLEWNIKLAAKDQHETFDKLAGTFERYWNDDEFTWYRADERPRLVAALKLERQNDIPDNVLAFLDVQPYSYQRQILEKLHAERVVLGHYRNLVVAATGTGKTVISAFDYKRFVAENPKPPRLLFVAHRQEILRQSLSTFRQVLKDSSFGDLFVGGQAPTQLDHLFISIQTFNSRDLPMYTDPQYYDYIVVDEFHHAAAPSYRRLLSYYQPKILLGLTATPERLDGKDVTEWFDQRVAAAIRLPEAIDRKLLAPFHYFGVSDDVDLTALRWSRGGYDKEQLSSLYTGNRRRAELVIRSILKYVTDIEKVIGLGFCVSIEHARFMAEVMNEAGIPSMALHAGSPDDDRKNAQWKLTHGELKFIFVVDLYNEGVDIPEVNTILFLRPTESLTVFLQQLGRGLRPTEKKECLTVLDFIGQSHKRYRFEEKFRALMDNTHKNVIAEIEQGFLHMPRGSFIQLERQAQSYVLENVRQSLETARGMVDRIRTFTEDTGLEATLTNFATHYNLSMRDFYRKRIKSFARLRVTAGIDGHWSEPDEEKITEALKKIAAINSRRWLRFMLQYLQNGPFVEPVNDVDQRMLRMFHYTVWQQPIGEAGFVSLADSMRQILRNSRLTQEIIEILTFNLEHLDFADEPVDLGYDSPLDLHCSYSRDQILAALDYFEDDRKPSMREGVVTIRDKNLDAFLVTLNKSDKDYSPTTMYRDYIINERLFHWQSQSTTREESDTGQRYIHHRSRGHHILLFVRQYKEDASGTVPYMFLGTAQYVTHQGSRPMGITWRLDKPMPGKLLTAADMLGIG